MFLQSVDEHWFDMLCRYWQHVSDSARDFIRQCLTIDQHKRPTADGILNHPWLKEEHIGVTDDGRHRDLLPHVRKAFNAKSTWRSALTKVRAANTFKLDTESQRVQSEVSLAQAESKEEHGESAFALYAFLSLKTCV